MASAMLHPCYPATRFQWSSAACDFVIRFCNSSAICLCIVIRSASGMCDIFSPSLLFIFMRLSTVDSAGSTNVCSTSPVARSKYVDTTSGPVGFIAGARSSVAPPRALPVADGVQGEGGACCTASSISGTGGWEAERPSFQASRCVERNAIKAAAVMTETTMLCANSRSKSMRGDSECDV